jgi:peptide/nickel transport system substrate-binding protein
MSRFNRRPSRQAGTRSRHSSVRAVLVFAALAAVAAIVVAGCGSSSSSSSSASATTAPLEKEWLTTTPAAKGPVSSVNWNLFYEPTSLDPAHSLNIAENSTLSNLCDTLVRQTTDLKYEPGLATYSNPDPKTWVYKIHPGVKFWDGTPLTAEDVAYSLNRNLSEEVGSYYSTYFKFVESIKATGPLEVTVKLTKPDEIFNQAMSLASGAVTEKKFDEEKGKALGTPSGGIMCSGPYKFVKWVPGQSLTIEANSGYWDKALTPKVQKIVFSFLPSDSAQTNALTSNEIQGMYETPISGTSSLQSSEGNLYFGKSLTQYVISAIPNPKHPKNPINNVKVRQAISLAMDREQIASTIFKGAAQVPASNTLFSEPVYPYAPQVFEKARKELPDLGKPNIEKAKELVEEAGSFTEPLLLAYPSDGPAYNGQFASYMQSLGQQIGLDIKLKPMPLATFNEIGFNESITESVNASVQYWFNELPDPVQWYGLFVNEGGETSIFNYGKYENATVNKYIGLAQASTDPTERAENAVVAEKQIMSDLPWIPIVDMANRLYMHEGLTGPPPSYVAMWTPWAAKLGSSH